MVPSFVLNPFQLLLNNLSDELHERNLHSLINVCADHIPGAQRERITTGWDAFTILCQRNVIGSEPEKMKNLLTIFKELRPKRKDLVHKIKRHIQDNYEHPNLILKDIESSSDKPISFRVPSTSVPHMPQEDCCHTHVHCPGLACSCNPCCDARCCCVILAILFTLLALVTLMAWSLGGNDVPPKITHEAVLCIVGVFGLLAVVSVISVIYIRYCTPRDQLNYTVLPISRDIRTHLASYATSDSSRTSYNSMGERLGSPKYECSCSQSGQNTASSSLTSRASSVRSYPLFPDDIVPNGFPWDDYPEFLNQNVRVEDEEADLIEV